MSKKIAIVGDSYSTYEGYVPEGYFCWYMKAGNECENDMPGVEKTWWYQLKEENDLELVMNCSFSGSAISYSGYPDFPDLIGSAFVTRIGRDLGPGKTCADPDVIFVFGGTNDFWAGAPLGELKFVDIQTEDLYNFAPAFSYLIGNLQKWNPNARIINILNDEITSGIREIMQKTCQHYHVEMLALENIEKQNGHPNTKGMRQIADQVAQMLK